MENIKNTVILAGSGRSGTTWLGCILNSYEKSEYYYEICAFPELHFTDGDLIKIKYPYTYWLPQRYRIIDKIERKILNILKSCMPTSSWIERALRVNAEHEFKKNISQVNLFKIVNLFSFALNLESLKNELGERIKLIHIIRNPFSQLMSEMRIDARNPQQSKEHFKNRIISILENQALKKYHNLAESYKDSSWIEQMALVWRISNELMLDTAQDNMYRLVYEDFARNPMQNTELLFEFLGWEMSDQTKNFVEKTSNITESSPGMFSINKNANEAINRWRNEISLEDYKKVWSLIEDSVLITYWDEKDLVLSS